MFALWGNGLLDDIRAAARHKSIRSAEIYYRDAKYLLMRAIRTKSQLLKLCPKWQPILIENLPAGIRIANDGACLPDSKSIHLIALTYYYYIRCVPARFKSDTFSRVALRVEGAKDQ